MERTELQTKILDIFINDKSTTKYLTNHLDLSDDEFLAGALRKRPKNIKLNKLINDRKVQSDSIDIYLSRQPKIEEVSTEEIVKVDNIPYIQNDQDNVTMFINNEMVVINKEHANFKKIIKCLENKEFSKVPTLLDIRKKIKDFTYKNLTFKNDKLYHKGKVLHSTLVEFIIKMIKAGEEDIQPFMRFLNKLLKNPSKRAQKELYGFLSSGKIPINKRGNILTYKRIRDNWTDCHSGKFDNSVGQEVSMERSQVDDRSHVTCSQGLHVCSYSYLSSFGGARTVVCEVNPEDVVSIPTDYNNTKMRCCKYKVIKELENDSEDILSENPIYF